jgi:WD40 repeat protein
MDPTLTSGVHSVRFNSDGSRFLTAHRDGTVVVWDTVTRAALLTLEGHVGLVWDASFAPDDSRIASASFDGTVRLWDAATGEEVLLLRGNEAFASVDFDGSGRRLLTSGGFGARVYVIDQLDLFDVARQRLHRWWLDDECRRFLATSVCPDPPVDLDFR